MSVTCTYYRIREKWIDLLIQLPEKANSWVDQLGDWVEGDEVESRIYCLDSAWDVAQFLLNECDNTATKILRKVIRESHCLEKDGQKINGLRYLASNEVKKICQELEKVSEEELKAKWDKQKMLDERVYKSQFFTKQEDWKYIMEHIHTINKAFSEASENNQALICRIEL